MKTLCIICKDEETNILRLLNSVQGIFDEICITDTGSTDQTVQNIATHYPDVKITSYIWNDDFAAARNYNFSQAASDFIMWMDADDILTPEQANTIKTLDLTNVDVVISNYVYAPGIYVPRERILRRSLGLKWSGAVHESIPIPNARILKLDIGPTHMKSQDDIQQDKGRNERILLKEIKKDPSPRMKYYYATELFDQGRWQEAITAFNDYNTQPDINQLNAYYRQIICYTNLGKNDDAVAVCMLGIRYSHCTFAEFPCMIGQIYQNKRSYHEAIHWLKIASTMSPPSTDITVLRDYYGSCGVKPWEHLSHCYAQIGDVKAAHEANECALRIASNERSLHNREILRNSLFPGRSMNRPVRLSLGAGSMPTPSYRNTDLYPAPGVEEQFGAQDIPYPDSSVEALYSSHSLEHLCKKDAELAIRESARVLKPHGKFHLRIPDLEQCISGYLEGSNREWYLMTVFGAQHHNQNPESHFHLTGFTKASITALLKTNNFKIDSITNYDGWGTPSIEVFATQMKKVRTCFVCAHDLNSPTFRVVPLALSRHLNAVITTEVKPRDYDWFVFFRARPEDLDVIQSIHAVGNKVAYHFSEQWYEPHTIECFNHADLIITCSTTLAEDVQNKITTPVVSINDSYEV